MEVESTAWAYDGSGASEVRTELSLPPGSRWVSASSPERGSSPPLQALSKARTHAAPHPLDKKVFLSFRMSRSDGPLSGDGARA
ncbi:hypothetical protein MFU01_67650 [Myxococcus fulvus]|uniref:Uncharacterized protein n=1 Tax=Myxococcus fulvus TaxID=33 RepID=A0A511TEW9_MYXFU|nr:hypothetical protein MFU01_67650 [Myxococcus fulvus]